MTYVIFHDEWVRKSTAGKMEKVAESFIKLTITEISKLYLLIGKLFMEVNQNLAFTHEHYENVKSLDFSRDLGWWSIADSNR